MRSLIASIFLLLPATLTRTWAVSPAVQPTTRAAARAKALAERAGSFRLDLLYHGDQDKPYYSITLSCERIERPRTGAFELGVQITEAQAKKIIDQLAAEGFLDEAIIAANKKIPAPPIPSYTMSVFSGEGLDRQELYAVLGWGRPTLRRLDGLRTVLDAGAAEKMDLLLARLSGHRREWEAADSLAAFVAAIKAALPKGWECTVISEPGKMGHPHGLGEPLFRMDFTNPNESFQYDLRGEKERHHPSMRLHFHAIADKQQIMRTIEAERPFSWDIPIYFSETKDYLIVTSPPWINQGYYTDDARKLITPLEQALKRAATTQPAAAAKRPVSELVRKLSDPSNQVRADAATAIREAFAVDPTAAPNCHEKAYWERRIELLKAGTPLKDTLQTLLPDMTDEQRQKAMEGGGWSGQSGFMMYRLDDYWRVTLQLRDAGQEKLIEPPTLVRSVRPVWVEPPARFTGTWVTWHVNGQKAHEIQYRDGKYDGTFTSFYDDGSRCVEQHYRQSVCDGTDTGYYRSGKKNYEGQYKDGKQVGLWQWYTEDGRVKSTRQY